MPNGNTSSPFDAASGWKNAFSKNKFKIEFIITLIILGAVLFSFTHFLNFVENRQGVVIPDPILSLYKPVNLTWFIFVLIYFSLISSLISLAKKPVLLLIALQVYSLMILFRILAMYSIPLDPPVNFIILKDPFVELFRNGPILTKDLFFSGHTATLFLLFLVVENKYLKYILLVFTILVGIFLLAQHVHYTIDVISAPFFAYTSYRILLLLRKKWNL